MANFNFINLTDSVKSRMLSEVEMDIEENKLYISPRLNEQGVELYPNLLKEAIANGSEEMLGALIQENECLNQTEFSNGKVKKVPSNAAQLLSQSEFNRFYIRAVCLEAIDKGLESVEVYRARESSWSRPESEALIGTQIDPKELLEDLRTSIGTTPTVLPDINSGLSVKI